MDLLRSSIRKMAQHSIATGQLVRTAADGHGAGCTATEADSALRWMTEAGMIENGAVVDSLVSVKTVLSQPVPCGECDSRISIKRHLRSKGWTAAQTAGAASLQESIFNPSAPLEYFLLLRHCSEFLEQYDDAFGLKHNQSKGYYEALSALHRAGSDPLLIASSFFRNVSYNYKCQSTYSPTAYLLLRRAICKELGLELEYDCVPPGQKADVYKLLQSYFGGWGGPVGMCMKS